MVKKCHTFLAYYCFFWQWARGNDWYVVLFNCSRQWTCLAKKNKVHKGLWDGHPRSLSLQGILYPARTWNLHRSYSTHLVSLSILLMYRQKSHFVWGAVYIKCPGKIRSNNYSKSFHLFTDSEKLRFHLFKQKYTKLRQRNKKEKVSRC